MASKSVLYLRHIHHCTGHTTTGSFVFRGNQYIQLVTVLYCKLLTIGKQLPTFPHKVWGLNRHPNRWEASIFLLNHHFINTWSWRSWEIQDIFFGSFTICAKFDFKNGKKGNLGAKTHVTSWQNQVWQNHNHS